MNNTISIFAAHPDDPCTIAGIVRQCLKYNNVYVNHFSNGDSNVDVSQDEFLRTREAVRFYNVLATGLGNEPMEMNRNVFPFNASENLFIDDFIYDINKSRLSTLVQDYTEFVLDKLNKQNPDYVLLPHYDGSSQTHDFVHLLVREVIIKTNPRIRMFAFPGYPITKIPEKTCAKDIFYADPKGDSSGSVDNVYKNWKVGRFIRAIGSDVNFKDLGLHRNNYSTIDFPSGGLSDGYHLVSQPDSKLIKHAIEAFETQKLKDFIAGFKANRHHEILELKPNAKKRHIGTNSYMKSDCHIHIDYNIATYQFHLQKKAEEGRRPEHSDLTKVNVRHFLRAMKPVLTEVRRTIKAKTNK